MVYHYSDGSLEYEEHFNATGSLQEVLKYFFDADGNMEYLLYKDDNFSTAGAYDLYYYVRNATGDITDLFQVREQSGSSTTVVNRLAAHYEYDPYGNILSINKYNNDPIGDINPIRYKDYYYDLQTGWYQLGSRFYDSEVGRFLNADDVSLLMETDSGVVDKNLYAYCDGNPVMRKDDGGEFWQIAAALIGAGVGAAFEIGSQILAGDVHSIKDINVEKVLVAAGTGAVTAVAGPIAGSIVSGVSASYLSYRDGNSLARIATDGVVSAGLNFFCGKGAFSTSKEIFDGAKSGIQKISKVKSSFEKVSGAFKKVKMKHIGKAVRKFFRIGKGNGKYLIAPSVSGLMSSTLGSVFNLARN